MNKINFVTFFDINLANVFFTHHSSIKGTYGEENFNYFVGTDSRTIENYGHVFKELNIKAVNIEEVVKLKFSNHRMVSNKISIFTMARLIMFEIFPELNDSKKIIYIDCDTIVKKPFDKKYIESENNIAFVNTKFDKSNKGLFLILEFWRKKLNRYPHIFAEVSNLIIKKRYFNAGVIIINNKDKIKDLFSICISENAIKVDDQTLLNIKNDMHILTINDPKHNNQVKDGLIRNAHIYHFSGSFKPWEKPYKLLTFRNKMKYRKTDFYKHQRKVKLSDIFAKNKEKITLLLTLYKPSAKQLNYWSKVYNRIYDGTNRSVLEMHVLVDGTKVDLKNFNNKKNIYEYKINNGKFKMIYNHIKNGNVKTGYFKVCDPDDYISISNFNKLLIFDQNHIIMYKMTKFKRPPLITSDGVITKKIFKSKTNSFNSFGNSWTILPTEKIFIDKYYSGKRIWYHDDQLLGYIAYANGAEIVKENFKIYYYVENIGHTSHKNFMHLINNVPVTFDEISSVLKKSGKENPLTWPENYTYYLNKWNMVISDDIIYAENNSNEIIEKMTNIFSKTL